MDIINSILLSIQSGDASRGRILFRASMSYNQLMAYLSKLLGSSLIEYDENTDCYSIKNKGLKFMSLYREIKDLFD
jgi:predicted transcriptional regulator